MPSQKILVISTTILLGIAAIVLAAISLAKVYSLSLPLPSSLPALNIVLPLGAAIVLPLCKRLVYILKNHAFNMLPYLASTPALVPFALFVLSLVYALPSDLQSCAADQQWLRMFENKDIRGIRTIQTQLQCCGYNSMHDRAWPFPSRDTDARTCENTQHYTVACGDMWRREQALAATLSAIASLLNWIIMVLLVTFGQPDEGQIRLSGEQYRSVGFIEDGQNHEQERLGETPSSRGQSEPDNVWNHSTRE